MSDVSLSRAQAELVLDVVKWCLIHDDTKPCHDATTYTDCAVREHWHDPECVGRYGYQCRERLCGVPRQAWSLLAEALDV